ncbi:MAG: DUF1194 domain-containing protein [Hyphomicrobiaceae bacterium]
MAALAVALSVLSAVLIGGFGTAARAQPVDLELVLAVDISWSMDPEEQQLQREGYVAAFRDREVQRAIASGAHRRIAVTYIEWAGPHSQRVVIPWTVVGTRVEAESFAAALAAAPISRDRMTSISAALRYASELLAERPDTGARRVIDISGDGPNNAGGAVTVVRDKLVADGVAINGLPILLRPSMSSMFEISNLLDYYEGCVIGGPGSFAIPIYERSEFLTATRRKLLLEIAGTEPRLFRVQFKPPSTDVDCHIGEKLWQRYMDR